MKRIMMIALVVAMLLGLCACGTAEPSSTAAAKPVETASTAGEKPGETTAAASQSPETTEAVTTEAAMTDVAPEEPIELRVFSLKGPTSMGIATMLIDTEAVATYIHYVSTVCAAADEVTAALVIGDADVAMLPANAAAALYNKTGGFSVVAINTLGVLYVVENGDTIHSIQDLAGKTVCMTGKGTTPEYALRYLLAANGMEDQVTLEFKSEAQEVVAAMSEDVAMIGLLPQPFVTAATMQNDQLRIALDLTQEWEAVSDGASLVTGVTVVRNEILEQYPGVASLLISDCTDGVNNVNADPAFAAELIMNMGIVAKAPIAERAIPYCNLVCISGEEMKTLLSAYLQTLYDQNPKAVGEKMPDDEFYYTGE